MKLKNGVVAMVGTVGLTVLTAGTAMAAGSGYVPPSSPVPPGTPGGYTQVVMVKTVGAFSKSQTLLQVRIDGTPVTVAVPPRAFPTTVQIVVTKPKLGQVSARLPKLGLPGYQAIAGVGVSVDNMAGHPYPQKFLKPLEIFVSNRRIGPGDRVLEWNLKGQVSVLPTPLIRSGRAIWKFQEDPAFAVIAPRKGKHGVVPGATSPVTGKPFETEALLGLTFVAAGALLLVRTRRRSS